MGEYVEIVIALVLSIFFVTVFKPVLKRAPVVLYLIALIVCLIFLSDVLLKYYLRIGLMFYPYLQRGLFAFSLFVVVMFIGVLPDSSRIKKFYSPIRGEVSIVASILILGHIINYLQAFLIRIFSGFVGMSLTMSLSFILSAVLLILLVPLTITSFRFVRKRMSTNLWKSLQEWAYVFFGVIYLHLMLILAPAMGISNKATTSGVVYTVIFASYLILRLRKSSLDKKTRRST